MSEAWRLARYRFARSLKRSWGGALAIVVLLGATGGAALGSLVAARDTASSYTTFLAKTNASDFSLLIEAPNAAKAFARIPGVEKITTSMAEIPAFPISKSGRLIINKGYANGTVEPMAPFGGEYFSTDRVAVVAGHMANPRDPREFMATAAVEHIMGWHVGEVIRFGFFTFKETNSASFFRDVTGSSTYGVDKPVHVYNERLVGTIVFNDQVERDSIDTLPAQFLFTPAVYKGVLAGLSYVEYHFKVAGGYANVPRVERALIRALPPGNTYNLHNFFDVASKVNLTIRPEALALLIFGSLALVGAILTAVQLVARRLRDNRVDAAVLRALGARPRAVAMDALAVPVAAVVAGSLIAVVVGIALSPLSVIGPVRAVLPEGVHAEWGILLGGAAIVAVVTALAGVLIAARWAPGREPRRATSSVSRIARWGRSTGLPVPLGAGLTFALEPGSGRTSVPVRSVLVGVVAAVAMVSATLTFGSGFSTLVSHPSLYGWNFDDALSSSNDIPPQVVARVAHSDLVAAWASVSYGDATVNGQQVPIMLMHPGASWEPPLIAGHEIETSDQVVLGAGTMAQLHSHLGGTVTVSYGTPKDYPIYVPPRRVTVVGEATLPAIGTAGLLHVSMGTGIVGDIAVEPPAMVKAIHSPYKTLNGPPLVAIRFHPSVSREQRHAFLAHLVSAAAADFNALPDSLGGGDGILALGVQYPAQIVSYRTSESTPLILALAFSAGIVVAFGLTVAASARRRRRDLALFKSLGLRRRQLAGAVAAQATVSVLIGLVVGVPVGVVVGRWMWGLFARTIYAVPHPTVPWLSLVWLVLGALVMANVVAYPPGRVAARTSVAELLRAE